MSKSLEIYKTKILTGTVTQKSAYDRDLARKRLRNIALDNFMSNKTLYFVDFKVVDLF